MDWLTDNKIPVGTSARAVFDWLQDNGAWFFDGLADIMESLIDGILWALQTPPRARRALPLPRHTAWRDA